VPSNASPDDAVVNKKQVILNAASNYARLGIVTLTGVIVQAYVIRKLGREQYSILPIVQTAIMLFAIFPAALGNGAARTMAVALGSRDSNRVAQITTSVFLPLCALAAIFLAGIGIIAYFFDSIFTVPAGMRGVGGKVLLVLGIGGTVAIPFSIFRSGLLASQRFDAANSIDILSAIVRMPLVFLGFGLFQIGLFGFVVINAIVSACGALGQWLLARRLMPLQRVKLGNFDLKTAKEVGHFSGYLLAMSLIGLLFSRGSYIIINKLLDPTLLTGYSVVSDILGQCGALISTGAMVLLPSVAILHAAGDKERIYRVAVRSSRVLAGVIFPVLAFAAVFGDRLLTIYIGKHYASFGIVLAIMSLGVAGSATQEGAGVIAIATGHVKAQTIVGALVVVIVLALQLTFVLLGYGLMGIVIPAVVVTLAHRMLWWPWYLGRVLGCGFRKYFTSTILIPLLGCLPVTAVFLILRKAGFGHTLFQLVIIFAFGLFAHSLAYGRIGLDNQERLYIRRKLRALAGRLLPLAKMRVNKSAATSALD